MLLAAALSESGLHSSIHVSSSARMGLRLSFSRLSLPHRKLGQVFHVLDLAFEQDIEVTSSADTSRSVALDFSC